MLYDYQKEGIYVYKGTDGKPYLLDVSLNAEGKVISETETSTLLNRKYWEADAEGNFVKFVGAKNAWDCTVSPSDEWTKTQTNTGTSPANFNEIYTK